MTRDEALAALFPAGWRLSAIEPVLIGSAAAADGGTVHVLGLVDGQALGADEAAALADAVLAIAARDDAAPIVLMIDSSGQRMSRRDELLGLNEYGAHLAKALIVAAGCGHRTVAVLYGGSAAAAFITTALSAQTLVALPGAYPEVMDLPSMARVTKLPLATLEDKARTTAVFAPGLDNLRLSGAIHAVWNPPEDCDRTLAALLAQAPPAADDRDVGGATCGGRPRAAAIARLVVEAALADD